MAVVKQRIYCMFPKEQIREPLLYNLGQKFKVVPNICGASVTDEIGLVYLEIEGEQREIDRAIQYLLERRVKVDHVKEGDPPPSHF